MGVNKNKNPYKLNTYIYSMIKFKVRLKCNQRCYCSRSNSITRLMKSFRSFADAI